MTERSVQHSTFVVERCYPAEPVRVFAAWADPAAKDIWMDDGEGSSDGSYYEMEFKIGGYERSGGLGPSSSFGARMSALLAVQGGHLGWIVAGACDTGRRHRCLDRG